MSALRLRTQDRTLLVSVTTKCDNLIEGVKRNASQAFRMLLRDIDAGFQHYPNRERMHFLGRSAGAENSVVITRQLSRKPFGHLAAT